MSDISGHSLSFKEMTEVRYIKISFIPT